MDFETLSLHLHLIQKQLRQEHKLFIQGTAAAVASMFDAKILTRYFEALDTDEEKPMNKTEHMINELNKLSVILGSK